METSFLQLIKTCNELTTKSNAELLACHLLFVHNGIRSAYMPEFLVNIKKLNNNIFDDMNVCIVKFENDGPILFLNKRKILNKLKEETWKDDTSNIIVDIHGDIPKIIHPQSNYPQSDYPQSSKDDGNDGNDRRNEEVEVETHADVDVGIEKEEDGGTYWSNIDKNMIEFGKEFINYYRNNNNNNDNDHNNINNELVEEEENLLFIIKNRYAMEIGVFLTGYLLDYPVIYHFNRLSSSSSSSSSLDMEQLRQYNVHCQFTDKWRDRNKLNRMYRTSLDVMQFTVPLRLLQNKQNKYGSSGHNNNDFESYFEAIFSQRLMTILNKRRSCSFLVDAIIVKDEDPKPTGGFII